METPRLTDEQRELAKRILVELDEMMAEAAKGDSRVVFALRRFIKKRLDNTERGTSMERRALKKAKLLEQDGMCVYEHCQVPDRRFRDDDELELDRFDPVLGYTPENTQLGHHECHRDSQRRKHFS